MLFARYAHFESRNGNVTNARQVYERAVEFFGDDHVDEGLLISFAKFEEQQKEVRRRGGVCLALTAIPWQHERARVIYQFGLERLPAERRAELAKQHAQHEKRFGERAGIESVVVGRRRQQYERRLAAQRLDYDTWFDYLRLLESEALPPAQVRDAYERAIACVPLQQVPLI